jgi:hypothetical protein
VCNTKKMNSFSLGAQIGGWTGTSIRAAEQWLRDEMIAWKGDYSPEVREFALILRVDADIHTYTEMWSIVGAQKAKKKRDWIEVEIGIPEAWWKEGPTGYAMHLVEEIENGLVSMIQLLQKKNRTINAAGLLADWKKIKLRYPGRPEFRQTRKGRAM